MDCGGTLSLRLPDGSTRALDPALTIGRADLGSLDARVSRHQVSVTALSSREARVDVHGSNKCLVVTDIGAERTRIGKGESARLKPEDIVYLYAPLDAPPLYPCKLWPTAAPEEPDHFFAPEEPVRNSSTTRAGKRALAPAAPAQTFIEVLSSDEDEPLAEALGTNRHPADNGSSLGGGSGRGGGSSSAVDLTVDDDAADGRPPPARGERLSLAIDVDSSPPPPPKRRHAHPPPPSTSAPRHRR